MRRVAIVGAGQSGTQLAHGLLQRGYDVTLLSAHSAEELLTGPVMSSQCMFESALQTERALGLDHWADQCPPIEAVSFTLQGDADSDGLHWIGRLDGVAQSVDQRMKISRWLTDFAAAGGDLRIQAAGVPELEELARTHDLVVVATGKGDLGRIFAPDPRRSPYDRPQRALALTYVTGMAAATTPDGATAEGATGPPAVAFSLLPGVGEYFTFPALAPSGPCDIMVFEGLPGGPMDCWGDVRTPEDHLARSLEILREHFPHEAARCEDVALTDGGGVLRGRLTPSVRRPVATLPSGARVLGLGDAVVLNDPITGQGSNNAAKAATFYLDSIIARAEQPFDERWMHQTFEAFWRGWGQWVVRWTNAMLAAPEPHQQQLLAAAAELPALADTLANGFDDSRTLYQGWFDAREAQALIAEARQAEDARFDPRELRRAFGQYATGVTVITALGADGQRIGITANSFTSVSMDPPLVLWCPGKKSPSVAALTEGTHFAVNILAADQHDLSRQFATPADDKFAGVAWREGRHGVPLLDGAAATFECRTVSFTEAGDHLICLGEVERYDVAGGPPLVFHAGGYHVATKHPDL